MEKFVPRASDVINVNETIRKTGKKTWTVFSEKGRRLGSANSMSAAKRRLKQIEYFKHINESEKWSEDEILAIADQNGIDLSEYDMNEIILGMPVELEHGTESQPDANLTNDDPFQTLQIVLAHLKEFDKYYSDLLIPAEKTATENKNNPVPTFEEYTDSYTNDNYTLSDWYIGNNGSMYASDGRAARALTDDELEGMPSEMDHEIMSAYEEVIKKFPNVFDNISQPRKNDSMTLFGFSAPVIEKGPYSGSESWWTFGVDNASGKAFLVHDNTGQSYGVNDPDDLEQLLRDLIQQFYK